MLWGISNRPVGLVELPFSQPSFSCRRLISHLRPLPLSFPALSHHYSLTAFLGAWPILNKNNTTRTHGKQSGPLKSWQQVESRGTEINLGSYLESPFISPILLHTPTSKQINKPSLNKNALRCRRGKRGDIREVLSLHGLEDQSTPGSPLSFPPCPILQFGSLWDATDAATDAAWLAWLP